VFVKIKINKNGTKLKNPAEAGFLFLGLTTEVVKSDI
jgi:hypothetical protein